MVVINPDDIPRCKKGIKNKTRKQIKKYFYEIKLGLFLTP